MRSILVLLVLLLGKTTAQRTSTVRAAAPPASPRQSPHICATVHHNQGVTIDTTAKRLVVRLALDASGDDKVSVAAAIDPNVVQRVAVVNNRVQIISLQATADAAAVKSQLESAPGMCALHLEHATNPVPRRAVC